MENSPAAAIAMHTFAQISKPSTRAIVHAKPPPRHLRDSIVCVGRDGRSLPEDLGRATEDRTDGLVTTGACGCFDRCGAGPIVLTRGLDAPAVRELVTTREVVTIIDRLAATDAPPTEELAMKDHELFGGRGDHRGRERNMRDGEPWDERGGRGHGRGGGGRGHRMGRLFAHGDLHLVVLHLVAEKPRHGYELIKSIEEAAGGAYSPSPGTIYPALSLLEEQGWIEVAGTEGAKKLFAATAAGRAHLDANRSAVEAMVARMAAAGASRADVPSPILRAMENVKLALRLKVGRGPISPDDARAIADALDRAVAEIERI